MQQLSNQAFQRAAAYLQAQARPVDQARFAFHFADGQAAAVRSALAAYQNVDGGFGHALEPDLRAPASSAIATQQGLQILREIGADATEPLVQRAITYLLATLDRDLLRWEIVPPAVEEAPHAPWWTYGASAGSGDGFRSNPRAALIGYLCHYQALVPAELLAQLLDAQMDHFAAQTAAQRSELHVLPCYLTLASVDNVPAQTRARLIETLLQDVQGSVATTQADFGGYQLLPLDVASRPDAPLAATVDRAAVDAQLDYLIATQLDDGSWPVPWSWATVDQAAWARAERDWKGQIVVNRLRTLAAYGRMEQ